MTWTWLGIAAFIFILFFMLLGFYRGFIREVVATAFVLLSLILVYMVNPYVNDFLRNQTPLERTIQEKCDSLIASKTQDIENMGTEGQNILLNNLNLPKILTQQLKNNNTGKTYQELAVTGFTEFVSAYLTNLLVNGISFLITYLAVTVLIRVVLYLLDLISRLPVIHGINRIVGGIVGAGKAVIYLWIAMLIITLLPGTDFGKNMMELIEEDTILKLMYEQNLLIKVFLNIF